jgi:hypothetical protein
MYKNSKSEALGMQRIFFCHRSDNSKVLKASGSGRCNVAKLHDGYLIRSVVTAGAFLHITEPLAPQLVTRSIPVRLLAPLALPRRHGLRAARALACIPHATSRPFSRPP